MAPLTYPSSLARPSDSRQLENMMFSHVCSQYLSFSCSSSQWGHNSLSLPSKRKKRRELQKKCEEVKYRAGYRAAVISKWLLGVAPGNAQCRNNRQRGIAKTARLFT